MLNADFIAEENNNYCLTVGKDISITYAFVSCLYFPRGFLTSKNSTCPLLFFRDITTYIKLQIFAMYSKSHHICQP